MMINHIEELIDAAEDARKSPEDERVLRHLDAMIRDVLPSIKAELFLGMARTAARRNKIET